MLSLKKKNKPSTVFDSSQFNQFIIEHNVIGIKETPITLKSGAESYWYINWRTISNDAFLLDQLTDFVLSFCHANGLQPHCFYGVPEGATKLGVITQYKWARQSENFQAGQFPLPMGRSTPKPHGDPKDRFFIGHPQGPTIVLEDVTTTGGSILKTIDHLRSFDCNIVAAIGLSTRMTNEDAPAFFSKLESYNIPYFPMSHAATLLPLVLEHHAVSSQITDLIHQDCGTLHR